MATVVEKWKDSLTDKELQRAIDIGCRRVALESLKTEHLDAVCLLLEGKSIFVTLPTGYGKSAVFHVLPFCASSLLSSLDVLFDVQSSLFNVLL